ncbi:hypothetical protein P152DRAFT_304977 [Eremomyces bilateralis CBS 781.70]|uniref:Uncharacterized protein n=1 Tax=Eremomyces bilateralis CBS 781.70 TaxID=1392243 RepID=A0A6G1FPV9_9PEZI|nr:uncharacterized protein P152DRAFT_304977 [Eremomyces bilateralis CBS 781.70]KAF1807865.1 hypothetical protein P152DRAFT_304977 [Eremomyces bilateralis CBS 781.70]
MDLFIVFLASSLALANAELSYNVSSSMTITPGPESSCSANCSVGPPDLTSWVWVPVTITRNITLATVIYIVNNRTNTTKTTTITNTLPADITPPPTNVGGTVVNTFTYEGYNGVNTTKVITYPSLWWDYNESYSWGGTLNISSTTSGGLKDTAPICITAPEGGTTLTLKSHPPYPGVTDYYTWLEDEVLWESCMSSAYGPSISAWPVGSDATTCLPVLSTIRHKYPKSDDTLGLTYTLVEKWERNGLGLYTELFPELATYTDCNQTGVHPVQPIHTVGFLTETSVSFDDSIEPTPPGNSENPGPEPTPLPPTVVPPQPEPTPQPEQPTPSLQPEQPTPSPQPGQPAPSPQPQQPSPSDDVGSIIASLLNPGGNPNPPANSVPAQPAAEPASNAPANPGNDAGIPPGAALAAPAAPAAPGAAAPSDSLAGFIISAIGGEAPVAGATPGTGSGSGSGQENPGIPAGTGSGSGTGTGSGSDSGRGTGSRTGSGIGSGTGSGNGSSGTSGAPAGGASSTGSPSNGTSNPSTSRPTAPLTKPSGAASRGVTMGYGTWSFSFLSLLFRAWSV